MLRLDTKIFAGYSFHWLHELLNLKIVACLLKRHFIMCASRWKEKSEKLLKLMLKILVFKHHSAYLNSLQMLLILRRKKSQTVGQNGRNLGLKIFRRKRTMQTRRKQRKLHNMKKVETLCKNSKHTRKTYMLLWKNLNNLNHLVVFLNLLRYAGIILFLKKYNSKI